MKDISEAPEFIRKELKRFGFNWASYKVLDLWSWIHWLRFLFWFV